MLVKSIGILVFLTLIKVSGAFAQNPLIRNYSTKDGLGSSTIYSITQDEDGFMWFGTDVGVSRFDGKKFRNFTLKDGLPDNHIRLIKTDSKGRIWFFGANREVGYWMKGKIYTESSDTLLKRIKIIRYFGEVFFEDIEQKLWFKTNEGEYTILDKNKLTVKKVNGWTAIILNAESGQIIEIFPEGAKRFSNILDSVDQRYLVQFSTGNFRLKDGSILFIAREGVVWQRDRIQKLVIPFNGILDKSEAGNIILAKDSLVWITTQNEGLYCYDLKNPEGKPTRYMENKVVTDVFADKEGNIWISTETEGLFMIPFTGRNVTILNKENGLLNDQCFTLSKKSDGELIVGLNKGKVQSIANNKILKLKMPDTTWMYRGVTRILCRNNDIWIASNSLVMHLNQKTGCNHFVNDGIMPNSPISSVKDIAIGKDKMYVASNHHILEYPATCSVNSVHDANVILGNKLTLDGVFTPKIYSIYSDHTNRLWFGTSVGLGSRKDTSWLNHSKENELLGKRISCIAETDDSTLVLATNGYGVLFYKNARILKQVNTASGLCSDICRKVFVHSNRIYVSTPSGVSVLYYSKGKITKIQNLNTGNFLPSNDVYDVFVDDVDISVSTIEGIATIKHGVLESIQPGIPLLSITEIRANDSIISAERKAIFSYDQNSFKIGFIGIYYQQPDDVNYRYRLKDDQPWQATKNTELEFSFLPPGKYVFQLQAHVLGGDWSPVKSFAFTIKPPFWKTIWFIVLLTAIAGFLVYLVIKRRLKTIKNKEREKAQIEKQITQLEQQALQTMMNPHFIFNVMNSIQHYINANDKRAANQYLSDFAKLIRMNLNISYKKVIPLDEEIEYLNLYLSFEKLRFGDNLTYEIIVDPDIDTCETTVAVMMIQPFIENAVWHGILPGKTKGHIRVQIDKVQEDLIKIRIADNGVGIDELFIAGDSQKEFEESHALSMTLKRLILLGKASGQQLYLSFKHAHPEKENKGTIAELVLPYTT